MTTSIGNRRKLSLATLAVALVGLVAMALPLTPAKAQVGVQIGPFGFGVAPAPGYVYSPPAYPYVYYGPGYYRGYYYGPGYYRGYYYGPPY
jgi:hypothetical protein